MRLLSVLLIIFLSACSIQQDEAALVKPVCDLSYSRYQATVTGYCQEVAADIPESVAVINKQITIKPLKDIPDVFWFNKKMKYSLIKQETTAPLILLLLAQAQVMKVQKC